MDYLISIVIPIAISILIVYSSYQMALLVRKYNMHKKERMLIKKGFKPMSLNKSGIIYDQKENVIIDDSSHSPDCYAFLAAKSNK